jgi:hypothetical protein
MPYIKISDPNTIDLAAWHQVVNVVNQHSDSITAITNNFGVQGNSSVDWNGAEDFSYEYDPGSQKMIYGRTRIDTETASSTTGDHMYYADISFASTGSGTSGFSARPIINVTARLGSNETSPPTLANPNIVATVTAVQEDQFTVRLVNARSTTTNPITLNGSFYINWIAVGPK